MASRSRARHDGARHLVVLNWRDLWHPEGGGSELYVQQVAGRLAAGGTRVTLFSARYAGARRTEEIDGLRFVRRGGHLTVYIWAALYLLTGRFGRVDNVLEVQNGMPFLARLFTRAPVVVLVHHVHREQWPVVGRVLAVVGWFLESRVAVRVNRRSTYVAVSDVTREELVSLGVDRSRIALGYNGVPPVPEFEHVARAVSPRLCVLSRLVPHKQVEHAMDTLAALLPEFPDLELDVMGSGWWEPHLREHAEQLGVLHRVNLLGHVSEQTKFEVLSQAWVHLLPSIKEGWGLAIIEAAQVGVPSIAYRSAGGVQESIQDGVTGMLADSFEGMVDATRQLLSDSALRTSLGEKAELRSQQFSWAATTQVFRDAFAS